MNTLVQNNNTIISRELTAVEMENLIGGGIDPVKRACWGLINLVSTLDTTDDANFPIWDAMSQLFTDMDCWNKLNIKLF